ncbi:MAG: toxin-antitoxin system protein [Clostridiales bacterium]|uniref:Toxin-antitoxin system protein n=1 Tax=Harryflintia acetispora TaxID=1849041 RepID=A0A9X8ULX1_9FIRM|nr:MULTISPECIES: hypothetical protein [Oscillospiraceae]PWM37415.1 MAG: toxin-antitoxin system protein [Clostridiales bacterium]TCL45132.1 hypothetical protein EDD78_101110 [Harryflintia acetispora]
MSPVTSPLKEKVSITLDSDVVDKITQYARMDGRNFSQYINFVLMRHIRAVEKRQNEKKTL